MKSPARDSLEAESYALRREGRVIFVLLCLVLATMACGALALHWHWIE